MAFRSITLALVLVTILAPASAELVKGYVFCFDCAPHYDYTGIRVMITCEQMKKPAVAMTITKKDGSFESKVAPNPNSLGNCKARLLGGPKQLYALQKNMVSNLVKVPNRSDTYSTSTTLTFATACSTLTKFGKCGAQFGSSKTVDLPIPKEYGLPPTSYYVPVLPIIGIP